MKKFIVLALIAIMSLSASAQLISSSTVTYKKSEKRGYNRIGLAYNSVKFDGDANSGISLDWTKGISLSSKMPLFIESGAGLTYCFGDEGVQFLYLTVPVNVTYKLAVAEGMKVAPFLGVTLQGNLAGEDDESDWFDDYDASRFNVGFQVGANVELGKFFVGLGYGMAFNDFIEGAKQKCFKVSAGIVF